MGMGGKEQHQGLNCERYMLKGDHGAHQEAKYHKHPEEETKSEATESKRESNEGRYAHAHENHNDIPPKLSPVFSTSLSSPSFLARGKGRKIGLASNPTVARIVGLDIPGEPIMGLENAKFE